MCRPFNTRSQNSVPISSEWFSVLLYEEPRLSLLASRSERISPIIPFIPAQFIKGPHAGASGDEATAH